MLCKTTVWLKGELPCFVFNGRNHPDFNKNWKTFIRFYDCGQVFQLDYETPAADADAEDVELHN